MAVGICDAIIVGMAEAIIVGIADAIIVGAALVAPVTGTTAVGAWALPPGWQDAMRSVEMTIVVTKITDKRFLTIYILIPFFS